ncbi:MAG: hypothetical protein QNJ46_23635 [Leptolyngbyaceae cyanobacterium MO_188.B28]|nr:hypothetical protein [Leptolyngbyaceae cyanobacterium MO_188.B28]
MSSEILKVLKGTYLKQTPVQSSELAEDQIQLLPAGTVLVLHSYDDSDNGHLKVVLKEVKFKDKDTWHIFKEHVELTHESASSNGQTAPSSSAFRLGDDLASHIIRYMESKGFEIFQGANLYNIVYVEGMNPDGSLNQDLPNQFNDIRVVIEILNGKPKIAGGPWEATSEPGKKYTIKPLNRKGAARIKFGQYKAWQVGYHQRKKNHLALVQTGGEVTVHRDLNKNMMRDPSDKLDTGHFGINQHHGWDSSKTNVGGTSAGCLVGRTIRNHVKFMNLIMQDKRYKADKKFVYTSTIISGDELHNEVT